MAGGVLGCYWALPCPDNRPQGDCPRPPRPLHPRDLYARITVIGWERYWAAARPIRILGLLNQHEFGQEMTEKEKRRIWPPILVGAILLLLVVGLLGIPSIRKYIAYEEPNAVPRLRENIGNRVQIPQQSFVVLGKTHTSGPYTGVLRYVGYRFNDKVGVFDCEIHLETEREGDSSVHTRLSPKEVQQVKVIDDPNQTLQRTQTSRAAEVQRYATDANASGSDRQNKAGLTPQSTVLPSQP